MVFSTNQVRQLYVVTSAEDADDIKNGQVTTPGTTALLSFDDWGQHQDPKTYEFIYVNALGDLGHSDLIHRENIRKVNYTPAWQMRTYLPTVKITNNLTAWATAADDADPDKYKTGDVFYVNFSFPGFLNATDEEVETKTVAMRYNYNKLGEEMATTDSGYDDWAQQMVDAITLAFNGRNNLDNDLLTASVSGNDVLIEMKEGKPWINGISDNKPTRVVIDNLTMENWHTPDLVSLPLENNSRVRRYGTATDITGQAGTNFVTNGKSTADLEYFCMGERGDHYRMIGWPNYIPTKYMVDPNAEYNYLDIHYYFQGEGVRSDKSEKVITLVATANAESDVLAQFYETIVGSELSIPTPPDDNPSVPQYTITVVNNDPTKGTVDGDGVYNAGTEVTLTATPETGVTFVEWRDADGATLSTDSQYTFTASASATIYVIWS